MYNFHLGQIMIVIIIVCIIIFYADNDYCYHDDDLHDGINDDDDDNDEDVLDVPLPQLPCLPVQSPQCATCHKICMIWTSKITAIPSKYFTITEIFISLCCPLVQ